MSDWSITAAGPATAGFSTARPARADGPVTDRDRATSPAQGPSRVDRKALQAAVEKLEAYAKQHQHSLQFRIDDASGKVVVSIIDAATGDTVRQIPTETTLRLAQQLENGHGSLLDGNVRA